jgi:hypothetical protein
MPTTDSFAWYHLPDGRRIVGNDARLIDAFLEAVPEMWFYRIEDVVRVFDAARRLLARHGDGVGVAGIDSPPPALPLKLPCPGRPDTPEAFAVR